MTQCLRECCQFATQIQDRPTNDMPSVNSKAAFLILKAGAKHVEEGGKIITIVTSLLAAFTGFYTSYAGSKAPVEHFTRGVAKELQGRKISVNAVAPGPMDTGMFPHPVVGVTDQDLCSCSLLLSTRVPRCSRVS